MRPPLGAATMTTADTHSNIKTPPEKQTSIDHLAANGNAYHLAVHLGNLENHVAGLVRSPSTRSW